MAAAGHWEGPESCCLKSQGLGLGVIAQWLRVLADLPDGGV